MFPESPAALPAEWLRHARSHLALAQAEPPPDVLLEILCFHAQQAAEKALKGVLVARSIPPSATHNLRSLLDLIPDEFPPEVEEAGVLTSYVALSRQPGDREPVDNGEYLRAVRAARAVVQWAGEVIGES